jgi:hypothetical protein
VQYWMGRGGEWKGRAQDTRSEADHLPVRGDGD